MISHKSSQNRALPIVSITPLKVQADSRTFKQATSVARFGYTSIVVEGYKSDFDGATLPFQLRTITRHSHTEAQMAPTQSTADLSATTVPASRHGMLSLWQYCKSKASFLKARLPAPAQGAWRLARFVLRVVVYIVSVSVQDLQQWLLQRRQAYREFMVSEPVLFVQYVYDFFYKYGLLPLKCTPKASLYYLHAFYQFPAVYLLCLWHGTRYIYDAHDFYSRLEDDESLSSFWSRWIVPFERVVETWCIKHAAAVVTVNDGIAQLIQDSFGPRAVIIRNTHDLRLDQEPLQHLRQQLQLSPDQFLVVSVGHAKPGMAIEEMLKALLSLPPNVHVAFLGDGYAPYTKTVQEYNLEDRVHFVPPVKPYEVVPFIRSADAAIVLYYSKSIDYQYSLPNRFFQSIAAELPLLYPELSEIKRLAELYSVGTLIDPRSPQSISTAIEELMRSPEQVHQLKHNLCIAKEKLSWEHEEEVLRDLLARCLSKP
jgi:glycosyltransferase involved in cell wall biosynthesis